MRYPARLKAVSLNSPERIIRIIWQDSVYMSIEVGQGAFNPAHCHSLIELLQSRATLHPDKVAFTFLPDGGGEGIAVTYGQLNERAMSAAVRFRTVIEPGDRALMLFPSGLEFIYAFFGCLYGGIIAVPAYPPRRNQNMGRLKSIIEDCDPSLVLTTSKLLTVAEPLFAETEGLDQIPFMGVDLDQPTAVEEWQDPNASEDTLAFLQYTSGSTGNPKGVMVSHGNLIYNEAMITHSFASEADDVSVSWLPMFHDMGLIGTTIQPLYVGATSVFMSPASFLQKPLRWLQAISDYRGTAICAPNFAYELCVSQVTAEQKAQLDLSSLKIALSGAEAVRPETLEAFIEAFAPCGFKAGAFNPTFGLAEATLMVSSALAENRPHFIRVEAEAMANNRIVAVESDSDVKSVRLVSNGISPLDAELAIVDPSTLQELDEGLVGEIWSSGPHIAKGYWRKDDATQETFQAFTQAGKGPFMRTGDLGCLVDGELYITGRQKDVIIIRGRNHYPQDVEYTVQQSHVALKSDAGAAFTVEVDGEERLVVVQEVERKYRMRLVTDVVSAAIRQAVAENHEIQVHTIVFLKPGSILKTSSGKIQRSSNRTAFLEESLAPIAVSSLQQEQGEDSKKEIEEALSLEKEEWLALNDADREARLVLYLKAAIASEIGEKIDRIKDDISLMGLGIDSLQITQLFTRLRDRFEINMDLASLFDAQDFQALAGAISEAMLAGSQSALPPLEPAPREALMPLSFSQKRMWFMDKLRQGNTAYNLPFALKIQGALDIDAAQKAFQSMVTRHEVLRTAYVEMDGHVYQHVQDPKPWVFSQSDLSYLKEPALSKAIQDHIDVEARKPFDLASGPVIRTHLLKLPAQESGSLKGRAAEQWLLLITMHHIAADGFSLKVITDEITGAYGAFLTDSDVNLPQLGIQYVDFAHWQKQLFESGLLSNQLDYWVDHLKDVPVLDMPLDHPRPPEQSLQGDNYYFELNKNQVSELKRISRNQGVTFYMTLLTSFKVLLHHYTQGEDICVGTPIANRTTPELEKLIGFFVNTLALRTDLSGNPSFTELMQRVRKVTQGAFSNQEMPFERVVEALSIPRDLSYSQVFQVMFVLQNSTIDEEFNLAGVNVESLHTAPGTSKFDMTLEFSEESGVLKGNLEFSTDLFEQDTMVQMVEHLKQLVDSVIADPQQPIGNINILSPQEKELLLQQLNDNQLALTDIPNIHGLFEAQVRQQPSEVAYVCGDQRLSYEELNKRANQLARYLVERGVESESLVGVCMSRRTELLISLLAIFKAGGAYVPIDPNYPSDRVAYMLQDSEAPIVISESCYSSLLSKDKASLQIAFIDELGESLSQYSSDNLDLNIEPQQLAYVIYTSGSTGLPKGVMIEHRNVIALVQWAQTVYNRDDLNGVLAATSICFDLSVFEFFVTLATGGKVILADNILELGNIPAAAEVRLLNTVPSAIATLLHSGDIPASVAIINLAGEALSASLVDSLYDETQVKRVYDLYGPSEDTTYSTFTLREVGKPASIGKPINNTQAYVLNPHGQLVAPGLAGELYLAGAGVTRGYRNRDQLTAERYIENPFGQSAQNNRMYRTGDLVRYSGEGTLEYLGRIDHQVKVRGFRIELGEIQSCIKTVAAVKDCLVVTREDAAGSKILVGYLVSETVDGDIDGDKVIGPVRETLKQQLPEYMMPAAFVLLDAFPLTPNGKIDRSALPEPSVADLLQAGFVSPRDEREQRMAVIWQDVLGLEQVGIHNNFFELGGHSLLATKCVSRVRDEFGVDLQVKSLFTSPTIAELCAQLDHSGGLSDLAPPPVHPVARDGDLPLSFAQMRLWFLNQLETGNSEYNISTSYNMPAALRLSGQLNVNALRKAFQALVQRHEVLRTSFLIDDGRATQVIREPSDWFMDVRDLRHLDTEEREAEIIRLAEDEATRSFDLVLGALNKARRIRLLRTRLLQTGDQEHVLLLTKHHIISDGWSLGILIDEMGELYRSIVESDEARVPELVVQYADYASWQRQWMEGPVFDHQLGYWREHLRGVPVLELPTDRPRPAVMTFNGSYEPVKLTQELTQKLNALSRDQGVTLFMTLLSGFYGLLSRYSGQTDICIGTPVANRARPEFESLIGCFVNSLALRVDLENDPRFVDLLLQVQDVTLAGYSHQDLPFEKLVDALGVARDKSHTPLFQVMFTLQNAANTLDMSMPGVSVEMLPSVAKTAKFDITLNLEEGSDGLQGMIEYNTDLFDRATVHRMVGHLERVLETVVEHPHMRISELPLLSDTEQQTILTEWNHQPQAYDFKETIHGRVETSVQLYGDNQSVQLGDECLSYSELNGRANQLAYYLRKRGVTTNQLVGISLNRNLDMVVAILAVLKAGGAYAPIDPANPEDRIRFIIEDAGVQLLITETGIQPELPSGNYSPVVLDTLSAELAALPSDNLEPVSGPDDVAYVIYTSGTTGKPKGVLIPHSNVIRLFTATDQWFSFNQQDVWSVFHSFAFDFSVWELWGALFFGGKAVIVPTKVAKSTEDFYRLVCEQGVTVLNQTPSAFTQFIRFDEYSREDSPELASRMCLRYVVFGGEALDFAALQKWHDHHGLDQPQLINMYGITETTVHVTYHRITEQDLDRKQSLIGRPIPDLDFYILDQHLNPVPVGVPGEIHVGGQGLAHGYLNRSDLTQQRFVNNPFGTEVERTVGLYHCLYKTGDLGRLLPNGVVEYMGRIDDQVKIRGYRIELGEIESTISQFEGVRETVVLAREDVPGDKRLVAYVQMDQDDLVSLQDTIKKSLPDYMVPKAYVVLDQFPLTPNGKVDKRNLPMPGDANVDKKVYVAPRNETESALADIWQDVLQLDKVGVTDNFFDLGGHSLLATQVVSRVREYFNVELPLSSLFEEPTIENIALHLLQAELESAEDMEMADLLAEIEGLSEDDLKNL